VSRRRPSVQLLRRPGPQHARDRSARRAWRVAGGDNQSGSRHGLPTAPRSAGPWRRSAWHRHGPRCTTPERFVGRDRRQHEDVAGVVQREQIRVGHLAVSGLPCDGPRRPRAAKLTVEGPERRPWREPRAASARTGHRRLVGHQRPTERRAAFRTARERSPPGLQAASGERALGSIPYGTTTHLSRWGSVHEHARAAVGDETTMASHNAGPSAATGHRSGRTHGWGSPGCGTDHDVPPVVQQYR